MPSEAMQEKYRQDALDRRRAQYGVPFYWTAGGTLRASWPASHKVGELLGDHRRVYRVHPDGSLRKAKVGDDVRVKT